MKYLALQGWRVFATARNHEDVDKLSREGFEAIRLDVDDAACIKVAVEEVLSRTGGTLHALFSNAGYGQIGAVEDLPLAAIRRQFETNVFGAIYLAQQVIPIMRRQGHGRIIFNSSVLGYVSLAYRGAYSASKFALESFADTLRLELHGSGIHVTLVEPGPITAQFRENCLAPFETNIDRAGSIHSHQYEKQLERLRKPGPAAPFTLPAEAVAKRVAEMLESTRPQAHLPITFPAVLFFFLKRVLPTRALDALLRSSSG